MKRGDQGHLNIIDQLTGFKIDIYPFQNDPLVAFGFEGRRQIELIRGELIWVAPPEYVILKKLSYYQEGQSQKHLEDISAILEVSAEAVDRTIIEQWVQRLRLMDAWNLIL